MELQSYLKTAKLKNLNDHIFNAKGIFFGRKQTSETQIPTAHFYFKNDRLETEQDVQMC